MKKEKEAKVVEEVNYPHPALQKVEDTRLVFWKSYKFHNTLKMFVLIACLAAVIVAFVVVPKLVTGTGGTGLMVGIFVVALGGTYGYSLYVRKKFEKKMKEYFDLYFSCCNDYVYGEKPFSNAELIHPGKITLEDFNESGLYKDVIETGSRGKTTFKYNDLEMTIVDCAGNVKAEKRMKPVFVGKMITATAKYDGEYPVFVYLKGNDRALPPTNMEGVEAVLENEKMVVYSNYKDWKKVLTGPVTKALETIKTDDILVDVAFSIGKGKTFVMLGYDDPLMVLPLQKPFDYKPTEIYKNNMAVVCKVIEALNK